MNGAPMGDAQSRRVRRNQVLLFSAMAAVVLAGFAFWLAAPGGRAPAPAPRIAAELAGPGTAEESWTRRSETRLGSMEARLKDMETDARRLREENERLRVKLEDDAEDARRTIDRQATLLEDFIQASGSGSFQDSGMDSLRNPGPGSFDPLGVGGKLFSDAADAADARGNGGRPQGDPVELQPRPLIEKFALDDLKELEEPKKPKGPDGSETGQFGQGKTPVPEAKKVREWLPAGSHARAVVLAGVDASAGISSQGDPRPVLLRITGPAWTAAADGAALSVDIEGCTVTGAAHGDLSSEKVYARLRTMTCAGDEPGTVTETEVAGFVANVGKAGVRGPVVSREGALVGKAFLAGVFSGVGQGFASAYSPQAVATGGGSAAVANTGLEEIGRAGLGGGAATAGGKVADYLIRRAEQYQPVIQLRAGTPVSVVFIEGARLGGGRDFGPKGGAG